jgi:hypothetical protein
LEDPDRSNYDSKYRRSNCITCRNRVSMPWKQCHVFLCLDAPARSLNCWFQFHNYRNIVTGQRYAADLIFLNFVCFICLNDIPLLYIKMYLTHVVFYFVNLFCCCNIIILRYLISETTLTGFFVSIFVSNLNLSP